MVKIGLYLHGDDHTIEKYSQILLLFERLVQDDRFKTYLVIDEDAFFDNLEPLLHQNLGEVVPMCESTVIGPDKLDAIIMITPYPPQPKPPLRKWETKLIYKEYGTTGIDHGYKKIWSEDAVYKYADMIITDSLHTKEELVEVLHQDKGVVGSPAYDYPFYVNPINFEDNLFHVLWTPHHSIYSNKLYDGIFGGRYSTWLKYRDFIPSLVDKYPIKLHVKLHPAFRKRYQAYCNIHRYRMDLDEYLEKLSDHPNIEVIGNESYYPYLLGCDAILNDSISFLQESLPSNTPMLVLYDEGRATYNEYGENLIDQCYYRAHNEEEIDQFIQRTIVEGIDYKATARNAFCNKNYMITPDYPNSWEIIDIIYNKYNV